VQLAKARDVLDARALLKLLAEHQVDYVVVGGLAVQTHGFVRSTVDLDIIPRPDLSNLGRLAEALGEAGATMFGTAQPVNVTDPHLLQRAPFVPLMTEHGRFDILSIHSTAGAPRSYEDLKERALQLDLDGTPVTVVGLDDLIRMKRAAGRDEDLADIRALTAADQDLEGEAREST
jgi:predicted nucleotidyltransferase